MRRRTFLLGVPGAAGCLRNRRHRLNVYNWSDYMPAETLAEFEREFGISIRYGTFESIEEMLAKVLSGNSGWDVVFPSCNYMRPMIAENLLAGLDHAKLPNLDHLDLPFADPPWDPGLAYGAPYFSGFAGIGYRRDLVHKPPVSWFDLWDPALAGHLTMLDDPADTIGAALLKLGHPVNSVDPGHLTQARQELIEQKRIVLAYMNVETRTHLLSGDVHAAHNWATNILFAVDQGSPTSFAFPREGFSMYCDSAAILRESRRADLAHHFLNFLMRPEIAARGSSALNACPVTKSAFALMPEAKRNSPVLNPSPDVLLRGQWLEALPAAGQRLRDRIWTEVKSA